jgi:DNA-binding response OmpR family regulator
MLAGIGGEMMRRVLIIAGESGTKEELRSNLVRYDFSCTFTSGEADIREIITRESPDIVLFDWEATSSSVPEIISRIKKSENLPVIALIPEDLLAEDGITADVDDFIAAPYEIKELLIRINRLVRKPSRPISSEQIECDGLIIDLATCEVTIDGRLVELTFKEYELLKLLAANKGRVFTREALLDKIWGYDYYGGDRTVDVHIRRLRSKIEDAEHIYIETVRNIGYRFIKG